MILYLLSGAEEDICLKITFFMKNLCKRTVIFYKYASMAFCGYSLAIFKKKSTILACN